MQEESSELHSDCRGQGLSAWKGSSHLLEGEHTRRRELLMKKKHFWLEFLYKWFYVLFLDPPLGFLWGQ